jgi:hypothetical protein
VRPGIVGEQAILPAGTRQAGHGGGAGCPALGGDAGVDLNGAAFTACSSIDLAFSLCPDRFQPHP